MVSGSVQQQRCRALVKEVLSRSALLAPLETRWRAATELERLTSR